MARQIDKYYTSYYSNSTMTDTPAKSPEKPRVLTVDTDRNWSGPLQKRFRSREIDYQQAEDLDEAIELLNSGDFTAVITGGLKGGWRTMVEEAGKMDVRAIVLSNSSTAVHKAQTEGALAFHTRRSLTEGGMESIIRAATRPRVTSEPVPGNGALTE